MTLNATIMTKLVSNVVKLASSLAYSHESASFEEKPRGLDLRIRIESEEVVVRLGGLPELVNSVLNS